MSNRLADVAFAAQAPPRYTSPEVGLMLAVLQDALATFQRGLHSADPLDVEKFREVDRWLRSRDYDWPFSFENICSTLRIDADFLRAGLNEIRRDVVGNRAQARQPRGKQRIYTRRAWAGQLA